jgi:hypothetical protein
LIAYVSNESGENEVYVRPFAPGANNGSPWQISEQGGLGMASWRKDGKELYFMAAKDGPTERHLYRVPLAGGTICSPTPRSRRFQARPRSAATANGS